VILEAGHARGTRAPSRVKQVVLPHSGVGLVKPNTGLMPNQSCVWA
jgi:hypothetical protein